MSTEVVHKVLLKPLEDQHSDKMFEWVNNKDLIQFNARFKPVSRVDHDRWFDKIRQDPTVEIFAIELENAEFIGSCQLHTIRHTYRHAEFQIRIGETGHHGKGYGTEATRLLLKFGFEELRLNRIWLTVFENNPRARKVYENLNFKEEGLMREHALIEGEYVDIVVMGLLRNEFTDG